ncbi:MAG: VOC family protein [Aquisalimonadaceae bacterium]
MKLEDSLLHTHHTAICVNDFERAKAFYLDFLGFELEGEMDHRDEPTLGEVVGLPGAIIRWAMLRHGSHRVELFKYYAPQGDTQARRQCDFGYNHLAFEVADVDAVYAQVLKAGYETVSPPRDMRGGRTRVFYLKEPEGAITEFLQFSAID